MSQATVVVFLLLLITAPLRASELTDAIAGLESAWAQVYYQNDEAQQQQKLPELLKKAEALAERYPQAAEPKIWQATIMITNAGVQSSINALSTLSMAKNLLEQAIQLNPLALDGSAYLTLGVLYYKVPPWPVSFGDNLMAENMLKTSLKINPNGLDANYFYGDFLLEQDRASEAAEHFRRALQTSVRPNQSLADMELHNAARQSLAECDKKQRSRGYRFMSLFDANDYSGSPAN